MTRQDGAKNRSQRLHHRGKPTTSGVGDPTKVFFSEDFKTSGGKRPGILVKSRQVVGVFLFRQAIVEAAAKRRKLVVHIDNNTNAFVRQKVRNRADAFHFMTSQEIIVSDVPVRALRVTFVGELG